MSCTPTNSNLNENNENNKSVRNFQFERSHLIGKAQNVVQVKPKLRQVFLLSTQNEFDRYVVWVTKRYEVRYMTADVTRISIMYQKRCTQTCYSWTYQHNFSTQKIFKVKI